MSRGNRDRGCVAVTIDFSGDIPVAVDVVQAGIGDTVLVIDEGNGARQILGLDPGAIRAVVVGVVDEVTLMN